MNSDKVMAIGVDLGSTAAYVARLITEDGEGAAYTWAYAHAGYYTRRGMINLVDEVAARLA